MFSNTYGLVLSPNNTYPNPLSEAVLKITSKSGLQTEVLIDFSDVADLKKHTWSVCPVGLNKTKNKQKIYIRCTTTGMYLHRFLMQPSADLVVDHIDGNTLNNRRSNLRIVTVLQNSQNRVDAIGIMLTKSKKYRAYIGLGGKTACRKVFNTLEAAWLYRRDLEIKHFGFTNKALVPSNAARLKFGI